MKLQVAAALGRARVPRRWSVPVVVLLALGIALVGSPVAAQPTVFTAQLSGAQEVPPVNTLARGAATFVLNPDGTALSYRLIVANIENVQAAHIHLAPAGVNGPVVAFLFGFVAPTPRVNGVLAEGTITSANLIGPLLGHPLSDLIAAMEAGSTYADVHTTAFLAGEIRGQIP